MVQDITKRFKILAICLRTDHERTTLYPINCKAYSRIGHCHYECRLFFVIIEWRRGGSFLFSGLNSSLCVADWYTCPIAEDSQVIQHRNRAIHFWSPNTDNEKWVLNTIATRHVHPLLGGICPFIPPTIVFHGTVGCSPANFARRRAVGPRICCQSRARNLSSKSTSDIRTGIILQCSPRRKVSSMSFLFLNLDISDRCR